MRPARTPVTIAPEPAPAANIPDKPFSLRRNAVWLTAGMAVYSAAQWGVVVLLAKLGTPHMVGQVALGLAIGAPVFLLANLRMRAVLATDASEEHRLADYMAVRVVTSALGLAVMAAIAFLQPRDSETRTVILWIGLAKLIESGSDLVYGLLQRAERVDRIAISLFARGGLSVLMVGLLLARTGSVVWASAGLAAGWLLVLLAYDLPQGVAILGGFATASAKLNPFWDSAGFRRLLWLTMPLGLTAMFASLTFNIPRYFVEGHLGQSELGIFGALAYLGVAMNVVVNAVAESGTANLGRDFALGRSYAFAVGLTKLLSVGAAIGAAGILTVLLFGSQILSLVYTSTYAGRDRLLLLLMITAAATNFASILSQALIAVRRFRANLAVLIVAMVLTAVLCFYLVPSRELEGAAWASAIGMTTMSVLAGFIVVASIRNMKSGVLT